MSKIRKFAKGQQCQVRLLGVCNFNPETTVLAHINGYGMGGKHKNLFGSFCCSSCHDAIDGRTKTAIPQDKIMLYFYEGVFRTQKKLIDAGLIKLED